MSSDAWQLARGCSLLVVITRCSSLDNQPTPDTFNSNAGLGYDCVIQTGGVIQDVACLSSSYAGLQPLAVGSHFFPTQSGNASGIQPAAPGVLLESTVVDSTTMQSAVQALRPGIATIFSTSCSSGYYVGCTSPNIAGLAHVHVRQGVSLDVIRTTTYGSNSPIGNADSGPKRIVFDTQNGTYGNTVLVFARDANGIPLGGTLPCNWSGPSGVSFSTNRGPARTGGASIVLGGRSSATITVTCIGLSLAFEVDSTLFFPDAGFDAPSDASNDVSGDASTDAPTDGGDDG